MPDTIPSIDDCEVPVGDDTLFGDYNDEVTVEQIALLNDSFAHLGMDGWEPMFFGAPSSVTADFVRAGEIVQTVLPSDDIRVFIATDMFHGEWTVQAGGAGDGLETLALCRRTDTSNRDV